MTPALKTKRLRLYAPHHRTFDLGRQASWLNDARVVKYSEQRHRKHSEETQREYVNGFDHVKNHIWEISHLVGGYDDPIGTMTAYRDLVNGTADVGILIGSEIAWGDGYGQEAWRAVCDWLLSDGIRKIEAGCMLTNQPMLRVFDKTGMAVEGIRVGHFMQDGAPVNMVMAGRFRESSVT